MTVAAVPAPRLFRRAVAHACLFGFVLTGLLAACAPISWNRWDASWIQTDPSYQPEAIPGDRYPWVFLDRAPSLETRSVGVIEVSGVDLGLEQAVNEATVKGKELGCWGIIDRRIYTALRVGTGVRSVTVSLETWTYPQTAVMPPRSYEFLCLVPREDEPVPATEPY